MSTHLYTPGEIRERLASGHYDGPSGNDELALDLGLLIPGAKASRYKGLLAEIELALLASHPERRARQLRAIELYAAFSYAMERGS